MPDKRISVDCVGGNRYVFTGHYCRELETENWHYYKDVQGNLYHFRKEHIIAVTEEHVE